MSCARWTAVEVTVLDRAFNFFTSRSARNISRPGCQSLENRIETANGFLRPANHHAVAAFQTPHAATGADVYVIDAFLAQANRAARIVFVIRVASVDDRIAALNARGQVSYGFFGGTAGGHHNPGRARLTQLVNKIVERLSTAGSFAGKLLNCSRAMVPYYAFMPASH